MDLIHSNLKIKYGTIFKYNLLKKTCSILLSS